MLDLPICARVADRGPVYTNVIVVTEIQEFFSCELSAVVGDDRVRDPEMENDVLDEIHGFLEANFGQGLHLDPLSEFVDRDKQVSQVPSRLLEGS
jgi:hypothetical protein